MAVGLSRPPSGWRVRPTSPPSVDRLSGKCTILDVSQSGIHGMLKRLFYLWRTASSGTLRRVALVRTDVSEELSASIIRVTRIGELGTLAVTSNCSTRRHIREDGILHSHRRECLTSYKKLITLNSNTDPEGVGTPTSPHPKNTSMGDSVYSRDLSRGLCKLCRLSNYQNNASTRCWVRLLDTCARSCWHGSRQQSMKSFLHFGTSQLQTSHSRRGVRSRK
jgi:hypothetical protein